MATRTEETSPRESLLRVVLLLIAMVGFTILFWPQYALFWNPVRTDASIIKLEPEGMTYKFYVPSEDKTLFFERDLLLDESQKLRSCQRIEVVYPAFKPDYVVIPSLQRPLPVWVYVGIELLILFALLHSVRALKNSLGS